LEDVQKLDKELKELSIPVENILNPTQIAKILLGVCQLVDGEMKTTFQVEMTNGEVIGGLI